MRNKMLVEFGLSMSYELITLAGHCVACTLFVRAIQVSLIDKPSVIIIIII